MSPLMCSKSRSGDLGVGDVESPQLCQPGQALQPGVGTGSGGQVQLQELGQLFDCREAGTVTCAPDTSSVQSGDSPDQCLKPPPLTGVFAGSITTSSVRPRRYANPSSLTRAPWRNDSRSRMVSAGVGSLHP